MVTCSKIFAIIPNLIFNPNSFVQNIYFTIMLNALCITTPIDTVTDTRRSFLGYETRIFRQDKSAFTLIDSLDKQLHVWKYYGDC